MSIMNKYKLIFFILLLSSFLYAEARSPVYKNREYIASCKLQKTDFGLMPLFFKAKIDKPDYCYKKFTNEEKKEDIISFNFKTRLHPVDPKFPNILNQHIEQISFIVTEQKNQTTRYTKFNLQKHLVWSHNPTTIGKFPSKMTILNYNCPNEDGIYYYNSSKNFFFDFYKCHDIKLIIDFKEGEFAISIDKYRFIEKYMYPKMYLRPVNYYGFSIQHRGKNREWYRAFTEFTDIQMTVGIERTPTIQNLKYPRYSSKHYRKAIKKYKDADAMYWLGMNYYEGSHGELKDYYQAVYWFRKAAVKKHVLAYYQLGLCYMLGAGITTPSVIKTVNKPDHKKAYYYFLKSSHYYYSPAVAMCMYYMISGLKSQSSIQIASKLKSQYKKARYQGNANVYFYHDYAIARKKVPWKFVETVYGTTFSMASRRNHPKAYYFLAKRNPYYINFEMYKKAAELNFIPAYVKVGDCYFTGNSVTRKQEKNAKWIKVQVDMKKAFKWYRKSAEAGDNEGKYKLGRCYALGLGTKLNIDKARSLFNDAALAGLPRAIIALSLLEHKNKNIKRLFFSGKEKQAFKWLKQHPSDSNIFSTAMCLKYGIGTKKTTKAALALFLKTDVSYAALETGKSFEYGTGTDKDINQAIEFYKKAVAKKVPRAAFQLAEAYYKSYSKISDRNLAFKWYGVAAQAGHPLAAFKLGEIYFTGMSRVPRDYKKAFIAFKNAAELGNIRALFILGDMCYRGLGTEQDKTLAAKYWEKFETAYQEHDNNSLTGFYWKDHPRNPPIELRPNGLPKLRSTHVAELQGMNLENSKKPNYWYPLDLWYYNKYFGNDPDYEKIKKPRLKITTVKLLPEKEKSGWGTRGIKKRGMKKRISR